MLKTTKPLRVLIVDDDPIALRLLKGVLDSVGHVVCGSASDGAAAVEQAGALVPDVVVMDVSMPKLDGLEATRRMQLSRPVPVVLLTAHDDMEMVTRGSEAGAGAYVVKPLRAPELVRAIAIASARFGDWMKLRRINEELEAALAQVRRLEGLLPICASCKKIRDNEGSWHSVETYIQGHSEAKFTHGLCMDCTRVLYPEISLPPQSFSPLPPPTPSAPT